MHSDDGKTSRDLLEELRAMRALLDQMPAMIWTTDEDFRLTSWSGGGLKALGLVRDQLVGIDMYEYFGTRDPEYPPIAAHHRAIVGESVSYGFEFQDISTQCSVQPLYDGDGLIRGVIGVALDISDRKREAEARERRIAELEQRLRETPRMTGLLSICCECGRVRGEDGSRQTLESYVLSHSEVSLSHGLCPECLRSR